jgi:hypothetical protein
VSGNPSKRALSDGLTLTGRPPYPGQAGKGRDPLARRRLLTREALFGLEGTLVRVSRCSIKSVDDIGCNADGRLHMLGGRIMVSYASLTRGGSPLFYDAQRKAKSA